MWQKAKQIFNNYSLAVFLFLLFLVSWIGLLLAQITLGVQPIIPQFLIATLTGWQAIFLGLFFLVLFSGLLKEKGSIFSKQESKGGSMEENQNEKQISKEKEEQLSKKIDRIAKELESLSMQITPKEQEQSKGLTGGQAEARERKPREQEFEVTGEQIVSKIESLVTEGKAKRILIKDEKGNEILEYPLEGGNIREKLAPILATTVSLTGLLNKVKIIVKK